MHVLTWNKSHNNTISCNDYKASKLNQEDLYIYIYIKKKIRRLTIYKTQITQI